MNSRRLYFSLNNVRIKNAVLTKDPVDKVKDKPSPFFFFCFTIKSYYSRIINYYIYSRVIWFWQFLSRIILYYYCFSSNTNNAFFFFIILQTPAAVSIRLQQKHEEYYVKNTTKITVFTFDASTPQCWVNTMQQITINRFIVFAHIFALEVRDGTLLHENHTDRCDLWSYREI